MNRRLVFVLLTVLVVAQPAAAATSRITVTLDRTAISTSLGNKFSFRSVIVNHGATPARDLIAHLNVLSLRSGVYIDPEDWSSHRTRYLPVIPAGGSLAIDWRLQAVNSGSIGVYVAVLPQSGVSIAPITGPTLRVSIAHRQTLNSGGILPLALGIPALLGALSLLARRPGLTARSARRPRAV
jgi:hypothetical protein